MNKLFWQGHPFLLPLASLNGVVSFLGAPNFALQKCCRMGPSVDRLPWHWFWGPTGAWSVVLPRWGVPDYSTVLQNLKKIVDHNIFPLFRLKAIQKTKFWKILCIFWPSVTRQKFYYITHLWEIELSRKIIFFKFFIFRPYTVFKSLNSTLKICSFDIKNAIVAQKFRE